MRNKNAEDLSVEEIRFLLVEKRRASRNIRLDRFRKTGRVVPFVGDQDVYEDSGTGLSFGRTKIRNTKSSHRTWLDLLLLCMEVLAVVGLIAIVLNSLSMVGVLNRSVAVALRQPTLVPTPMVQEVVLPEGHTPPNSLGGARPNEAEIPPHLLPLVQSIANLPVPTPGSQQAIRIQIPAINVDSPIVQGDGWEQLKRGVAQHIGTPNPGEGSNIVLSGHNDVYGEVFRDLDRLNPGDVVILFTSQRHYTYVITGAQMVTPKAVEVMAPTPDARVTLISCHPYLVEIHRIVITAVLQNS
jgi:sortase A